MPSPFVSPATQQSLEDIRLAKYFFLTGLTVLLYDHVCTLAMEVESFWKKRKTPFLYLFIFIRYYTPVVMSVVAFGFFSTAMTFQRCRHWMYFLPIAVTLGLMFLSGLLMAIRVYALWGRNAWVLAGLIVYLVAELATGIWATLLQGGKPFPFLLDNYEFHYCVFVAPQLDGHSSSYVFVFMDLAYNAVVFFLTVSRTIYIHTLGHIRRGGLVQSLAKDGAVYFGGIFCVNIVWAVMILVGRPGIHALFAMPSSIITVILVTRITLNLRIIVHGPARVDERTIDGIPMTAINDKQHRVRIARTVQVETTSR